MRDELTKAVGKGHLSYSSIKYALGDMRLWEMYMRGELKKESEALQFGTLYDMLLFEPEKAADAFYTLDDAEICAEIGGRSPRMTKRYKEWRAEAIQTAHNADKQLVTQEDVDQANAMIKRLDACGLLDTYLKGEYQVEFNVDLDGVPLRGFLDCLGDGFITDSKSTRSINKFKYDVNTWCYDIQAYIYSNVFGIQDFYWVAQEKTEPYFPALIKCTEETMLRGEMKFHEAVTNIKDWLARGHETKSHYAVFEV